jgi:RNA recognition motif-containing protein
MVRIFIGNLPFGSNNDDLRALFADFGSVAEANVVIDRDTGKSRGFGFVQMPNGEEAQAAIAGLNGIRFQSRALTVNEARPKPEGANGTDPASGTNNGAVIGDRSEPDEKQRRTPGGCGADSSSGQALLPEWRACGGVGNARCGGRIDVGGGGR